MSDSSDSEEAVFEDALENPGTSVSQSVSFDNPSWSSMNTSLNDFGNRLPLEETCTPEIMAEVKRALDLFLSNKFDEAVDICRARASVSVYHQVGFAVVSAVRSIMTFDGDDIAMAARELELAVQFANSYRRKGGMLSSVTSYIRGHGGPPALKDMSVAQLNMELIHAEAIMLRAGINIANDETFMSVVKGGLQMRSSFQAYKGLHDLLQQTTPATCPAAYDVNMRTGILLGTGGFNMMLSLLPSKILKVLEFLGMPSSRSLGLSLLEQGASIEDGIRTSLCAYCYLGYYLVITGLLELPPGDPAMLERVMARERAKYPNGTITLYFDAKLYQANQHLKTSVATFERAIASQLTWIQLHHICYWELVWCHLCLQQYEKAEKCARKLFVENRWSKSVYSYIIGVTIFTHSGPTADAREYFSRVESLRLRIASKSIPIEKFVARKARKFQSQSNYLFAPVLELIYTCGFMRIIGTHGSELLLTLDKEEAELKKQRHPYVADDRCLALLLRGAILREIGRVSEAIEVLSRLTKESKLLVLDHWIAPFGLVDLSRAHMQQGNLAEARSCLHNARSKYKHYSLESRLMLRAHVLEQELSELERK